VRDAQRRRCVPVVHEVDRELVELLAALLGDVGCTAEQVRWKHARGTEGDAQSGRVDRKSREAGGRKKTATASATAGRCRRRRRIEDSVFRIQSRKIETEEDENNPSGKFKK
jgi:hypothetical protein